MTTRYWVVGGEYEDPEFSALIPGTHKLVGPFENARKARNEWTRLTGCPEASSATTRYSIASETVQ